MAVVLVVEDAVPDVEVVDEDGSDAEWSCFGQPETVVATTSPRRSWRFTALPNGPIPMDTMVLTPGHARNVSDGEISLTAR